MTTTNDIVFQILTGDRNPVEDADDVQGTLSGVSCAHLAEDGSVIVHYTHSDATIESDGESEDIDLLDVDLDPEDYR